MAWTELVEKRGTTTRTYADGNRRRFEMVAKTRLHYESALDSGVFDAEIDCTPQRIVNAQFDGWRITDNWWHYALGRDLANHGNEDGWIGVGGRQGQHWVKFRLNRVGYLHWPSREWQDIGGAPTYNRANLSQQTSTLTIGPNDDTVSVQATATWANLWQTPGGGSLSASWQAEGRRLKEEITVNQAAREWITANRPPATPLADTYFGFVFDLDWSDVPKVVRQNVQQDMDGDWADDGVVIELRDAAEHVLAFMPLDSVSVPGTEDSVPIRKRFYRDGGNHYLLVGVRCDLLNGLPAGDLVFDPTFTDGYGGDTTTYKDSYIYSASGGTPPLNQRNFGADSYMSVSLVPEKGLIEFDLSSISADATCDSATFYVYSYEQQTADEWDTDVFSIASGNDGWVEGTSSSPAAAGEHCWNAFAADGAGGVTTAWAGSAGLETSGTDYEAVALGQLTGDRSDAVGTEYSTALTASRVEDWFGATNTNYGLLLQRNTGNQHKFCTSDHATTGYRPKLVVEYTAGGALSPLMQNYRRRRVG